MSKRDYDAEIAARDSEIAALMDENAKLWLALYPPKAIFPLRPGRAFERPTAEQFAELLEIVFAQVPSLRPTASQAEQFREETLAAFCALAHLPRRPDNSLNWTYDRTVFIDRCYMILRELSVEPSDISMRALMVGAMMHGDVSFCFDPQRFPHDTAWSLGDHSGRYPSGLGWKTVLQTRKIRPASSMPVNRNGSMRATEINAAGPLPRFTGGDHNVGEALDQSNTSHFRI